MIIRYGAGRFTARNAYSAVNIARYGFGIFNIPTNVTLSLATWNWTAQTLAVDQRQQATLPTATWRWNGFPLSVDQKQQVGISQVRWAWNAFALGLNGTVQRFLLLLGVGV